MLEKIEKLLTDWHEAGRAAFEKSYHNLNYDTYTPKRMVVKSKYIYLDDGTSGAFILEKSTGNIFRIKSKYGVPNRKKLVGNIENITGEALSRYRWY